MQRGLYTFPGACETACAAAAASSFDLPITKWSKVYRELSSAWVALSCPRPAGKEDNGGATKKSICDLFFRSSLTLKMTRIGCPRAIGPYVENNSACLDSFQSAANWSGTPTEITSPSKLKASVGSSHVRKVCSGMSIRARSSKRFQTSEAVSDIGDGNRSQTMWKSQSAFRRITLHGLRYLM